MDLEQKEMFENLKERAEWELVAEDNKQAIDNIAKNNGFEPNAFNQTIGA